MPAIIFAIVVRNRGHGPLLRPKKDQAGTRCFSKAF